MGKLVGKKIAFIVDDNFEQAEYVGPRDILRAAGADIVLLASTRDDVQGLNHIDKADTFSVDMTFEEAVMDEFDAVVFPGGTVNADGLRSQESAQEWVQTFNKANKPIAMICHAPWLAISAEVVAGRTWTSWPSLEDDIVNAGGTWIDQPVVTDGNFITSRNPDDVQAFSEALITAMMT